MAQITKVFNSNISHNKISIPAKFNNEESRGESLTASIGKRFPLIKIDKFVIEPGDIMYFKLSCTGSTPSLSIHIQDSNSYFRSLSNPGPQNEVQVEILPHFEHRYKKINLKFYVQSFKLERGMAIMRCAYKLPDLYTIKTVNFGMMSTYDSALDVARMTGLGFSSNVRSTNDVRYLNCFGNSLNGFLNNVCNTSISYEDQKLMYYDWWVDWWDHLTFADIYERFNTIDSQESMNVYSTHYWNNTQGNNEQESDIPVMVHAAVTNAPNMSWSDLFIYDLQTKNSNTHITGGTEKVFTIYNPEYDMKCEKLIVDGDQTKDINYTYEYAGECDHGTYNYVINSQCRSKLAQKMHENILTVKLKSQMLGLNRGDKVDVLWFDMDENINSLTDVGNFHEQSVKTNIKLPTESNKTSLHINRMISGQYLIIGTVLEFSFGFGWSYSLKLTRPRSQRSNYIDNMIMSTEFKDVVKDVNSVSIYQGLDQKND